MSMVRNSCPSLARKLPEFTQSIVQERNSKDYFDK